MGPLQSGQFDKIFFLQIILIIWIGLLVQSGWSSAICFANGPDIFEILMTTAIQVWWWILQPGQPPHPEQTGPEQFYRAITISGYLCKWSRSSGLMQSGHSRAKYFTNNPNWPASCKEYSHIQHLCRNSSGSFRFVSLFQRGMVWQNNPFSSNDPDHPDGFACPDDMRFVQNFTQCDFRAGRDGRNKSDLWSCCNNFSLLMHCEEDSC